MLQYEVTFQTVILYHSVWQFCACQIRLPCPVIGHGNISFIDSSLGKGTDTTRIAKLSVEWSMDIWKERERNIVKRAWLLCFRTGVGG